MYIKQAKTRDPVGSTARQKMKFKVIPIGTRAFGTFVRSDGRKIDSNRLGHKPYAIIKNNQKYFLVGCQ